MKMTTEHLAIQNTQLMVGLLEFQATQCLFLRNETSEIQIDGINVLMVNPGVSSSSSYTLINASLPLRVNRSE